MSLGVDDLLTATTEAQIKAKLYEEAELLGLPTTAWLSGAPTRTIIAIVAKILGVLFAPLIVLIAASGFLDDAEDGWLTLIAELVYGVARVESTFASDELTFDNAGGGIFSFDPGEVIVKNSTTGKTYVNTEILSVGALATGVLCDFVAQEAGSASSAGVGQIDTLVTTMLGVTVTNASALTGTDEETDAALRVRCRAARGALSPNGPRAAYEYVATTPELTDGANVNRVRVLPAVGDGVVNVIIAAPDGTPTGGDIVKVQDAIDLWATPEIGTSLVAGAPELVLNVTATLHVKASASLTDPEWEALAETALNDYIAALAIGGVELTAGVGIVPWRALIGALEGIKVGDVSGNVLQATLSAESDVAVDDDEVVVPGTFAFTITQV